MHRLSGVRVRKRWCRPGNWQTTKAATEKFLHLSAWLVLLLVWNCFLSFIDEKSGINYRILPKTATKLRKKIQHKGQAELGIYTKKAHRFDVLSCGGPTRTGDLQVMSLASYQLLHPAMFSWFRVQRYRQFSIHASFCTKKSCWTQKIVSKMAQNHVFVQKPETFYCKYRRFSISLQTICQ